MNYSYMGWLSAFFATTLIIIVAVDTENSSTYQNQAAVSVSEKHIASINANDFKNLVETDDVILIDVRTPSEFSSDALPGAINIDFYEPDFSSKIAALDPSKKYAIYCRSGNRTGQTLTLMQTLGFSDVSDLQGGLVAWKQHGLSSCTGLQC